MSRLQQFINEKQITLGGKLYPRFGNVVILAGGAASGKGYVLKNLLGIEGKVFDVDHLKSMAIATKKFAKRVKDELGVDLKKMKLNNPDDVSLLHNILAKEYNIMDKKIKLVMSGIMEKPAEKKPNLIFDVTLQNITKLHNVSKQLEMLGYDKKNIHIVWVLNDVVVAAKQNRKRSRVVPDDIFMDTHKGASLTMKEIIDMGDGVKQYMDGDIWIVFNQAKVDTGEKKSDKGGKFIERATYLKVKESGKSIKKIDILAKRIYNKIVSYVPKINVW